MITVDTVWFMLLMFITPDGVTHDAHMKFDTRRQCMSERSVRIEDGEKLIKEGKIKSFTVECVPVEVSKSGLKTG